MNIQDFPMGTWQKIYLPEATCAFGHPYCFHLRRGDPKRLVFYLCGGGVSWDRESAKWPSLPETREVYNHVSLFTAIADPHPEEFSIRTTAGNGIHSSTAENPFSAWTEVMVPYATGDFHTGAGDLHFIGPDGREKILHHHGYLNLQKVLQKTRELLPEVEQLLIAGESGGAYGVAAVSGDVMDAYPACEDVTILCDSALMSDDWSDTVRNIWQAPLHIADAVVSRNMVADWFAALHKRYGDKPRYLFTCGCRDETLMMFRHYIEDGRFMMDELHAREFCRALGVMCKTLKAISPRFAVYIHDFEKERLYPGVKHCIIEGPHFTASSMDGVTPLTWVTHALDGNLYDVGLALLEE